MKNNMAHTAEELRKMLDEKIKFGLELITRINPIEELDGNLKLQRKIRQEIHFLQRVIIFDF